ncbi:MAG: alpha/beta hydrolase [Mycobacterium sp.]|uniref:alpha/beta fold hydrolase n=1 Tax=Mycobacterium sp. TaxID=1785 RepID=UPI003C5F7806
MTTTPEGADITTTPASVDGAPTLLFIHGFLDDATVWDGVIASLAGKVNAARYDLPGFGARSTAVADPKQLSLQSLAAEAGEILDETDTRVIVVGQSLGTQIAELVAAKHADRVDGLVLLTPVPLGGTRLPDEAVAPFRALGGDRDAQRAARSQLSPALAEDQLDRLIGSGAPALPDVVARYVDIWNNGVSEAPVISEYTGPVLVIRGGADGFVTKQLVDTIVRRFPGAREKAIDRGGHWLHVEQPGAVAEMLLEFSDEITNTATAGGWRQGFAQQSQAAFADEFADEVVLDATTLVKPITGKQQVAQVLATASSIYESLEFTAEAHCASTTYLQWRATAFGGMQIRGITILDRDGSGKIVAAAIHHRPLGAVQRFAIEIRNRLASAIPADHFLQETT